MQKLKISIINAIQWYNITIKQSMNHKKQKTTGPQLYSPPKVWKDDQENGGVFANINRPISGETHIKALPVGRHPLQLYSLGTPNGVKVTIMLEELLALGEYRAEYDAWLINIREGAQFSSGFVSINPNSKIPVMVDRSLEQPLSIFESASILLYLAEKFDHFIPHDLRLRTECLSWLFWQMSSTPYVGGGFGHFYHYARIKIKYAIDRFAMETKRQLHVLEQHLAERDYVVGTYSIADIAIYPWYGGLVIHNHYQAESFLNVAEYPNVIRWAKKINNRPAVQRGQRVNSDKKRGIKERHSSDDF